MEIHRIAPNLKRRWYAGVAGAAVLLMLTACGAEDGVSEQPTSPPAATESDATDQALSDFTPEELQGGLVESFPSDVPLYDGEVVDSLSALGEVTEKPEWNATLQTDDAMDTVDAEIRSTYSANGWEIASEMAYGSGHLLITRGNGYTVSITYVESGDPGTSINYGVSAD